MEQRILLTECSDGVGLIAKVTGVCFKYNFNVIRQDQYASHEDKKFFMRSVLEGDFSVSENFLAEVKSNLPADAKVRLNDAQARRKLAVLVTKEAHCLGDLLMKSYSGALNADIVMVAGNYPDLGDLAAKFNVPFHCISHEGISREEHEEEMCRLIDSYNPDYVVLAKYMRILSPKMVAHFPLGKLINIHHSFLPAFIGAKPYQQAFDRGVKIIGATAHFVTDNLDEGPIIEQDVIKVNHRYSAQSMARAGRDVERLVLMRALNKILSDKVFIHSNKTVVF
ncbi:formyltetrahydrofolate deformylase [Succinatimonas hippei]|uniref:Formyltetrahydrofolate deformylase n=1 Tax=Succinatimonas hippei (strain DSM 22608 / JCM 16073 / KCTC 15190 / YIT 12066) TaxID=762983 RepID=E8LIG4_SUCHY|nr:formyltetrahydrofolate deformylase [Succinatimonas hippei]EFY07691.1 formyltetrahydrofolate deformylase [Succinatimonas hippei YIT 12066]MCL1602486.1 formyltetrahydrofolate deformylase [Succinatimonas hippei]MDM8119708.1 formyltetrahydrofolate deformylase [Succinatimonas hippei]